MALTAIAWSGEQADHALVAGDGWLSDMLGTRLPATPLVTVDDAAIVICEREHLTEVADETLRLARLVILLDPSHEDRLRARRLLAGKRDGRLVEIPSLSTTVAAEQTFTLMLALVRRLLPAYSDLVSGSRQSGATSRLTEAGTGAPNWVGIETPGRLAGKTLGIVGLGRIGEAVAQRAGAFGMQLIYHDLKPKPVAELRYGIQPRRFDQILREADIVSLHLPLTADTTRLIDAPELALMKPGAYLINTAHGRLIDEGSLIRALRERAIAGAGLDVFAYEPLSLDSPLLALDNVVLTPHLGDLPIETIRQDFIERTVNILRTAPEL